MPKGIITQEDFLEMVKVVNKEMKRDREVEESLNLLFFLKNGLQLCCV